MELQKAKVIHSQVINKLNDINAQFKVLDARRISLLEYIEVCKKDMMRLTNGKPLPSAVQRYEETTNLYNAVIKQGYDLTVLSEHVIIMSYKTEDGVNKGISLSAKDRYTLLGGGIPSQ